MSTQDAGAVPPPPPPPVPEEEGEDFNPVRMRMMYRIWDKVAIFGPVTLDEIYGDLGGQAGGWWRDYLRYHPEEIKTQPDAAKLAQVERWHVNNELAIALRQGFLVEIDGKLTIGRCPPEHNALQTVGGEDGVKTILMGTTEAEAMAMLESKVQIARVKPSRIGKAQLKQSLERVGQLEKIVMWQPPLRPVEESIVIDGQTRLDLLEAMGIEPEIRWLDRYIGAVHALQLRIEYEVAGSSKEFDRNEYIAQLASEKFTPKQIAAMVGLTRRHVARVLSQVDMDVHLRQSTPTEEMVAEWVELHEAGWSYRDISRDWAVWSKDTIQRYVKEATKEDADSTTTPKPKAPRTKRERLTQKVGSKGHDVEKNSAAIKTLVKLDDEDGAAFRKKILDPDALRLLLDTAYGDVRLWSVVEEYVREVEAAVVA